MTELDDFAKDAGRGLIESASHVDIPEISAVKTTRRRRTGMSAAALAFAGTLVVVGVVAISSGPGTPSGTDVAAPQSTEPIPPSTTAPPSTTVPPAPPTQFAGNVFVIDDGNGPVVCAGGVMESLPPQCGGPALDGLDWADVPWADTGQGQHWAGMYIEVGVAGERLQLLSAPEETHQTDGRSMMDFTPPCPAPEGGWVFTPGPLATDAALNAAAQYISNQPDAAGNWVYNLVDPPAEFSFALVLVATFTGDIDRHTAAISELWSGPLCVVERDVTEASLRAVQDELVALGVAGLPDSILWPSSYGVDIVASVVELDALVVTPEGQQWLDERYGPGVVIGRSLLEPVAGE
jgi:hypothetical protein